MCTGRADKPDPGKSALFIRTIGQQGNDVSDAFSLNSEADEQKYDIVTAKFSSFYAPRVNVVAMTHKLLTRKQGQIDKYVTALNNVARYCNFGGRDQYEIMIIQAFLLGIGDDRVKRQVPTVCTSSNYYHLNLIPL